MDGGRMTHCGVERKWSIPGIGLCGESLEGFFLLSFFFTSKRIFTSMIFLPQDAFNV